MGQAFDRSGNVLGEAEGETKREVFEKLSEQFKDAAEIRIGDAVAQAGMRQQIPTVGRIVHYRLSAQDAEQINRRRTTGAAIAARMSSLVPADQVAWPAGAQAHIGNEAHEDDAFPMLIVRVWGPSAESAVNGQVFLDGNDVLWATSVCVGEGPRTFSWPSRS